LNYKNNVNEKDNKPFVYNNGLFLSNINQIDTIGSLLAEILKIVQRIERRQEEFSNTLSRMKNDY
jgi:hypothetical protein